MLTVVSLTIRDIIRYSKAAASHRIRQLVYFKIIYNKHQKKKKPQNGYLINSALCFGTTTTPDRHPNNYGSHLT